MSGPILRKYGFPNFDKIFGAKPILHGVDEEPKVESSQEKPSTEATQSDAPAESPTERRRPSS